MDGMEVIDGAVRFGCPFGPFCPSSPCTSLTQSATASAVVQRRATSAFRRGSASGQSWQAALPQVVLIVGAQFFQTGARHVRKLELKFFRGAARLAALRDVLPSAPRCLHHLVLGPAFRTDLAVTEPHHVVAKLRDLEALQLPVAAVLRNERFGFHGSQLLPGVSLPSILSSPSMVFMDAVDCLDSHACASGCRVQAMSSGSAKHNASSLLPEL